MSKLDPFWMFLVALLVAGLYGIRSGAGASPQELLVYVFSVAAAGVVALVAAFTRHKRSDGPRFSVVRILRVGMASFGAGAGILILLALATFMASGSVGDGIFGPYFGLVSLGLAGALSPLVERYLE
jgi:hypothetical protein